MSLRSFHIIFILIASLFAIFFGYWCYREWTLYENNLYLVYSLVGVTLCICLFFYGKWFLKEISEINVN